MSNLPSTIGKYRVERELGKGASGTVYLAYDGFRDVHVAVKQIHAHLLKDPVQSARYRRMLHNEANLAGRLSHPHIVSMVDVDEQAEPPYLVLEYVKGKSLEAFTRPDALLPIPEVLDIAFKCCNALEYAQTEGLVHRDIKPANLMLRDDGELKLTDFGTALSLRSDDTQVAGLIGSPAYMSPEQVREETATHHSDMFSLGIVMYELLCGQKPFQGANDYVTIFKISSEEPVSLRVLRPALSPEIEAVVMRALQKKPAQRFASWRAFADALVSVNRSLPRQASQSTEAERFAQLRALPFFADFHDVSLWETLRLGKRGAVERGSVLMQEGAKGDSFYILLDGRAAVRRNGWALCTLSAGVSIGEMVYLQAGFNERTATVIAETDIVVMKIKSESLRHASSDLQASFDKAFIKMLVSRLIATNQQLAEWDIDVPLPMSLPGAAKAD